MTCHRKHPVIHNASCVTVSALEGTSKVAISKSSTSKNESFKNETLQNVRASKSSKGKHVKNGTSKSSMCTSDVTVTKQQCNDDSQTASATPTAES